MGEENVLLVLDVLRQEGGHLVTKQRLVVAPQVALDLYITVVIQLLQKWRWRT